MLNATLSELVRRAGAKSGFPASSSTRLFLDRIERLNAELNAFITVDADASTGAGARGRPRSRRGKAGPLTGIPIAHKDIFCAKGLAHDLRLDGCWRTSSAPTTRT